MLEVYDMVRAPLGPITATNGNMVKALVSFIELSHITKGNITTLYLVLLVLTIHNIRKFKFFIVTNRRTKLLEIYELITNS